VITAALAKQTSLQGCPDSDFWDRYNSCLHSSRTNRRQKQNRDRYQIHLLTTSI